MELSQCEQGNRIVRAGNQIRMQNLFGTAEVTRLDQRLNLFGRKRHCR